MGGYAGHSLAWKDKQLPRDRSQSESSGHRTALIPELWALSCGQLDEAVWGPSPSPGYLDTVLQAVAHGRADLLMVTEQRG